jgi:hypothetical protein
MLKELHFDETIISSTILVKVPRIAYIISEKKTMVPKLVVLIQRGKQATRSPGFFTEFLQLKSRGCRGGFREIFMND